MQSQAGATDKIMNHSFITNTLNRNEKPSDAN